MTIEELQLLFQKMSIHYSRYLPQDEETRNVIKQEYYNYLKDVNVNLVSKNFKNHVKTSKYLPTISDLIKDEIKSSVPGVEETRLMLEARDKERENHVPSSPEYRKMMIEKGRALLREAQLNELEREHKRAGESGFGK